MTYYNICFLFMLCVICRELFTVLLFFFYNKLPPKQCLQSHSFIMWQFCRSEIQGGSTRFFFYFWPLTAQVKVFDSLSSHLEVQGKNLLPTSFICVCVCNSVHCNHRAETPFFLTDCPGSHLLEAALRVLLCAFPHLSNRGSSSH